MADHPGTNQPCSSALTTHHYFYHRMLSLETVRRGYLHINRIPPQFLNMETKTTVLAYLEVSQLLVDAFLLLGEAVDRWKRRHTLIERSMIHAIVL